MAYWIHENGETIGPLRGNEVLERAKPETLISHDKEWVRFDRHPDFAHLVSYVSESAQPAGIPPSFEEAISAEKEIHDIENSDVGTDVPLSAPTNRSLKGKSKKKTSLGGWVVVVVGLAVTGLLAFAFFKSRESESPWVYSKAFDIIDTKPEFWVEEDEQSLVKVYRETLEFNYPTDELTIDGSVARIDEARWQGLERTYQALLLRSAAVISCECLDPSRWHAEVRDALTGSLLAATSPNGFRALWTADGYLPESPPASKAVDTESPMSRAEYVEALTDRYEVTKGFMRDHYRVVGEVLVVRHLTDPPPPFTTGIKTVLVQGHAEPVEGSEIDRPFPSVYARSSASYMMIFVSEEANVAEGSRYDAVHTFIGVQELSGKSFPTFLGGLTPELFLRYAEILSALLRDIKNAGNEKEALPEVEVAASEAEVRVPQTAPAPQTIDQKIAAAQSQLREVVAALRPIKAQYERLSRQHPTFNVSGEINDRGQDRVLLFGVALPSTGDITHLGAVVYKDNILVIDVARIDSPFFFAQQGLFFVEKTTTTNRLGGLVPLRVYSTQPSQSHLVAEQELERLRNEMRPFNAEINRLRGVLDTLKEEKYQQEWEAVIDSVPQLVAYAKEHAASGDAEGSERACLRIEEIGPHDADAFVECGLLSEETEDYPLALSRYREALNREPNHPMANRRETLLLSRQQQDPFEEARYLMKFMRFVNDTAADQEEVESRLNALKSQWGREARRACVEFDDARIRMIKREEELKISGQEDFGGYIERYEAAKRDARGKLQSLNNRLVAIGLDVQSLMIDSLSDTDYWRSREGQAGRLRSMISSTERRIGSTYKQSDMVIRRESIRQYSMILSEIEQEAQKVGVAL